MKENERQRTTKDSHTSQTGTTFQKTHLVQFTLYLALIHNKNAKATTFNKIRINTVKFFIKACHHWRES